VLNEIDQYLIEEELEHLQKGWISRREFLHQAGLIGVGAAAAVAMARAITPRPARAADLAQTSPFHVPEDDSAVAWDWITYTSADGAVIKGYLARPTGEASGLPGIAVCHANSGVSPHVQDVARRFANRGYMAIAPDLVSRLGSSTPELTRDEWSVAFREYREISPPLDMLDFTGALDFLKQQPSVDPTKLAATGYCLGGAIIYRLATVYSDLTAVAPFYGSNPPLEDVPNIRAAVFGVYGGLDERLNARIPDLVAAMDAAGTTYQTKIYPDSEHGFFEDGSRGHNPEASVEAWIDTLSWFADHLGLPESYLAA
jgi:carboxymethylenebutenolidase